MTMTKTTLLVWVLLLSIIPVAAQQEDFTELSQQLEPLKEQFNADAGKVRLVLLLDST